MEVLFFLEIRYNSLAPLQLLSWLLRPTKIMSFEVWLFSQRTVISLLSKLLIHISPAEKVSTYSKEFFNDI